MDIEIDQSQKIEDTNKDTAIAFSNNISKSILIRGKNKRRIQEIFREIGKPKIFIYKTFAILIFILIKQHIRKIDYITIDTEYPGWESLIKDYLLKEIRRVRPNFEPDNIIFKSIGRKSKAHLLAYRVAKIKTKPDLEIKAKEITKHIIK